MIELPSNFEKCENEYYEHHDPCGESEKVECEQCSKNFEASDDTEVFCSKKCYEDACAEWNGDV